MSPELLKQLAQLRPAEIFLLEERGTGLKDFMKYTFLDLLRMDVLCIQKETKRVHPRDSKIRTYTYFARGTVFSNYVPRPHEELFLKIFYEKPGYRFLPAFYLKEIYFLSHSQQAYESKVRESPAISSFYKKSFWSLFSRARLNQAGIVFQMELRQLIKRYLLHQKPLPDLPSLKTFEFLFLMDGIPYFIKHFDQSILHAIDQQFVPSNLPDRDNWIDFTGDFID